MCNHYVNNTTKFQYELLSPELLSPELLSSELLIPELLSPELLSTASNMAENFPIVTPLLKNLEEKLKH